MGWCELQQVMQWGYSGLFGRSSYSFDGVWRSTVTDGVGGVTVVDRGVIFQSRLV